MNSMKKNRTDVKAKKKNKKKKVIIVLILIILIVVGVFAYTTLNKGNDKIEEKEKVVDSIKDFDYTISDTDTKLFKTKFNELKKELKKSTIDNKKYSKLVAELFIIDFFTLDNKITKNDVGGVQFVYSNYKKSFVDKARDQFYKYVKNNLNDNRNQKLPVVETIKVNSIEEINASDELTTDEFKNIDEAYKVNLSWTYKEDLGYQTDATVIVVKDANKFSVAKLVEEE